jgi:hypothetical protein
MKTNIETNHSAALAAAATVTAAALSQIEAHNNLGAEVKNLKLRAEAGELDEQGAGELIRKAEKQRLGEITRGRHERALADALAAEVAAALGVLRDLESQLEPVERDALLAADALTAALIHPAAAGSENPNGYHRDRGRTIVESYFHGTYPAAMLRERITTLSQTTWGTAHIPREAAIVAAGFDAEIKAIHAGTAILRAALKAVQKIS